VELGHATTLCAVVMGAQQTGSSAFEDNAKSNKINIPDNFIEGNRIFIQ
jgi:hypothetical protein